MGRFRKKPVVIEAITFEELVEHGKTQVKPEHLNDGMPWSFDYKGHPVTHENNERYLIPTNQGTSEFNKGDMLISQIDGEIYPCNGKLFNELYEKIEE